MTLLLCTTEFNLRTRSKINTVATTTTPITAPAAANVREFELLLEELSRMAAWVRGTAVVVVDVDVSVVETVVVEIGIQFPSLQAPGFPLGKHTVPSVSCGP